MKTAKTLTAIFKEIVIEASNNPDFEKRLLAAMGAEGVDSKKSASHRRKAPLFDPFEELYNGSEALRRRLNECDIEQLRDIIASQGMDRAKVAMKWKDKERVISWILTTVGTRSQLGDAFRKLP
ncbi:MAG TPA: hypothetical protein VGL56_09985 [Fimbriimonadaceae bacterium]|jgi:hypothetical protein